MRAPRVCPLLLIRRMSEPLILALLQRAERWANRAGTTLASRGDWTPASLTVGRRPADSALLSAAAEVYDLLGATPAGCCVMRELRLNPEAWALPTHDALAAQYADHCARLAVSAAGDTAP